MTKILSANSGILSEFNRYLRTSVYHLPDNQVAENIGTVTTLIFEDGTEFASLYEPPFAGEQLPDWRKHDVLPRLR